MMVSTMSACNTIKLFTLMHGRTAAVFCSRKRRGGWPNAAVSNDAGYVIVP
jgi:hypothetical protein